MKGFIPTTEQLEAYKNGSTMFIVPIDFSNRPEHKEYIKFCIKCDREGSHIHIGDGEYKCTFCNRKSFSKWKIFEKGDGEFEDLVFQIEGTLQKDDEFFIQEEFKHVGCKAKNSPMYKDSYLAYTDHPNYNNECLATGRSSIIDASEMEEYQARFKDIVLNINLKKIQNVTRGEADKILPLKPIVITNLQQNNWFDNQFKKQNIKYEDNPYVFLIEVKGIEK